MRLYKVAVPLVVFGLVVSGCSGGDDDLGQAGSNAVGASSDINPKSPDELRDGGNLRLANTTYPSTFNTWNIDSDGEVSEVVTPMMPQSYRVDDKGELTVDPDYFTSIELTSTEPQQVTYTINPKATWTNGRPIDWTDLAAQFNALNGRDQGFLITASVGFDRVEKVERGVDDRQAVVTFNQHYAEWKGQYGILYPKEVMATPDSFNNSVRDNLPITAGPFQIQSLDVGQKRVVLGRNPNWWGDKPKLDTITFSALDISAWVQALQNDELDVVDTLSRDDIKTVRSAPGIAVRRSAAPRFSHLTFNGAPGSIVADPKLRVAIMKGIDRQGIATALQNGVVENPKPLNSHIFMNGQVGYQDNAGIIAYDPTEAAKQLDDLGWKLVGDVREKDGKKLEIRDVMLQQDSWVQVAQIMQQNLAAIGVKLIIDTQPAQGLFTDVIDPGNFDVAQFSWSASALPLGALQQIYYFDPNDMKGNKGRIGSKEINDLIDKTISELDPQKAIEMANEIDKLIFAEGFSMPFYQSAGNVAVRDTLANYGAFGLASIDYTKIGFVK
ncbi:ABC transporter family substrate-binding protein [Antrihabitans sp. NCIMB 15449]|uniref:ABC transporter family substrate-binding protein n=1 Tax=Antrihabitans spumae TaxID=3373370 RepID=A0ABW7JLM7_9NOCA